MKNNAIMFVIEKYKKLESDYEHKKEIRIIFWCVSIISIMVSVLVLNTLTPYIADDYNYLTNTDIITREPIISSRDYLRALYHFYMNWGGRITGVAYTYLFTWMPKALFNIINTIAYMSVITLIYFNCKGSNKHKLTLFISIHLLLWICVPDYGQVMFWVSGSANYLWASIPILGVLFIFRRSIYKAEYAIDVKKKKSPAKTITFTLSTFLLGVMAGWSSENASAGMLAILTLELLYFIMKNKKITLIMASTYLGGIIGFIMLIFAPGNYVRVEKEGINLSFLFKFFMISYFWVAFMIIICGLFILIIVISKSLFNVDKKITMIPSVFFGIGSIGAAYSMIAAPTSPERTWFIVIIYGIISIGLMYEQWDFALEKHKLHYTSINLLRRAVICTIGISIIFCNVMWADTVIVTYEIKTQTETRDKYIKSEINQGKNDVFVPIISHQYPLLSNHDSLYGLSDIKEDKNFWINQSIARYYGINSIQGYITNK